MSLKLIRKKIEKLSAQNEKLRNQLKEFSASIDSKIEVAKQQYLRNRHVSEFPPKTTREESKLKMEKAEKTEQMKMDNMTKKLEIQKKEIAELKMKITLGNSIEKYSS